MEEPLHRVGGIMPIGYIINQSMPLFLDCRLLISIDQDLFWPCLPVVSFYFLFFIFYFSKKSHIHMVTG